MRWALVPREPGRWDGLIVLAVGLTLAASSGALLFALSGVSPVAGLVALVREPFGSAFGWSETLLKAGPIALCALSVSLARRIGLWNIGAEGQLYLGAWAGAGLALHATVQPGPFGPLLVLLAGVLAGAAWAAIPALLQVRLGVSEILSTLLLNYAAIAWVELWVYGAWKGEDGFPYTRYLGDAWQLPQLFGRVHGGVILAVILAIAMSWSLRHTVSGYRLRLVGASPEAGRYAGIRVGELRGATFMLAGALAGLAGAIEVAGVQHRLQPVISPGYGYTAILAAFIAGTRPVRAALVAFLLAALDVGGEAVQVSFPGVSAAAVRVFQGVLFVSLLVGLAFTRLRVARAGAASEGA